MMAAVKGEYQAQPAKKQPRGSGSSVKLHTLHRVYLSDHAARKGASRAGRVGRRPAAAHIRKHDPALWPGHPAADSPGTRGWFHPVPVGLGPGCCGRGWQPAPGGWILDGRFGRRIFFGRFRRLQRWRRRFRWWGGFGRMVTPPALRLNIRVN
jgi:hypothetical protein